MTVSYPYALGFLSDRLRANQVQLSIARFDERSGSGDGRIWAAQLAPPLWQLNLSLAARSAEDARALDARLHALDGSRGTFLWRDPTYRPAGGFVHGLEAVQITAISDDRTAISLSGLPVGYEIYAGDRIGISFGEGRQYFATFAEDAIAGASGAVRPVGVFPYLPFGVNVGAAVELVAPVLKVIILPGGYTGFTQMPGGYGQGASLSLIQRV
ncbi:hypothetical protein [Ketogulonicigenium vulgare]|uniref:hypothetical protein n=1 Tax=Ketogulonicigenium vulgare TaxID=92945 RepID=UPI0023587EBB|nr:hypothetical protein [Ketogulonicigenium vulgare]